MNHATRVWHYVYYSYEEWGRGYIGCRSSKTHPDSDSYLGSFSDQTFKPTSKIVLQIFATRKEALAAEVRLHDFYEVDKNPHFANKARQKSTKFYFCSTGTKRGALSRSTKAAVSRGVKNAWKDPLKSQNMRKGIEKRSADPEWKAAHRKIRKEGGYRRNLSLSLQARWRDPEHRQRRLVQNQRMSQSQEWKKAHAEGCAKNRKYLYKLVSPDGHFYEVENLRTFCAQHSLYQEGIRRVAAGHRAHYKGWSASRVKL